MQFHVQKMVCGGCVKTITEAITAVDPNATVSADTTNRTIAVDTTAAQTTIERALSEAGYPARAA